MILVADFLPSPWLLNHGQQSKVKQNNFLAGLSHKREFTRRMEEYQSVLRNLSKTNPVDFRNGGLKESYETSQHRVPEDATDA